MGTLLITHPIFQDHLVPMGHPERPARLKAIADALADPAFDGLTRRTARPAAIETIAAAHPPAYIERLRAATPAAGFAAIDADTTLSPKSFEAARHAAGGVCQAVDAVLAGEADNAFCAVRPPGHHAEAVRAMGFCLFNNVAIGARHARNAHGLERVAIVDWDVHHGNGTQDIAWDDPSLLYASTHQMPLYPGTGAATETGAGNIFNAPLRPGSGPDEFRAAFETVILPAVRAFRPDLLMISAGFDAHIRDPLANLRLTEDDFAWATAVLMDIAAEYTSGRIVSVLEGGYDLDALARSTAAHVATLMRA